MIQEKSYLIITISVICVIYTDLSFDAPTVAQLVRSKAL